jgi:protein-disulfide isomerase
VIKTIIGLLFLSAASTAALQKPASAPGPAPAVAGDESPEAARARFLNDAVAPTVKPAKYDVTIVEYMDYQCPFCRKANPALTQLLASDHQVRLIYRDWPIFGAASVAAAKVAIASTWQGKHAAVHDALMNTPRPLNDAAIKGAAIKAGADWARLQGDLKAHGAEIDALLERNNAQAESLGLQGTPAFIINDYLVDGALDLAGLKGAVAKARSQPGKAPAGG